MKYKFFILSLTTILFACSNFNSDKEPITDILITAKQTSIDSDYDSLYNNAARLVQQKEYDEAEEIYLHLVATEPHKENALAGLAAVQLVSDRMKEAKQTYEQLLALDSVNYFALLGLGSCYFDLKQYNKAVSFYSKARNASTSSPDAYRGLAISYNQLKDREAAAANAKLFLLFSNESTHKERMQEIIDLNN